MSSSRNRRKTANPGPTDISVLMQRLLGGQMDAYTLLQNWSSVLGERVANHLQFVDLQKDTLVLRASSAPWQAEANLRKKAIIDACNALLGHNRVRDIRFS